jgi:hypothetical protein
MPVSEPGERYVPDARTACPLNIPNPVTLLADRRPVEFVSQPNGQLAEATPAAQSAESE